jgi:nucleoside-diphosphate-sugar epimerase
VSQAVTIVGAAGFVGRRLQARLEAAGASVFAPARGDPELFSRDLGCVYYCAGLTADYAARPFDTVEAHVSLLAELVRRARFGRLIYTSSTRLYDGRGPGAAVETDPLILNPAEPRHLYDLSKALGENLTLTQTAGRGAVARLSNVFDWSEGSPGFLSEWLIGARASRDLKLESSPGVARDYIHLDDVVDALIAIGRADDPGIVNVASGQLVLNQEIAEVFQEEGWRVSFSRAGGPQAAARPDIARLRKLGLAPRAVRQVIRTYLKGEAGH